MGAQRWKPAGTFIGLNADAKVGAVYVAVTVAGLVTLVIGALDGVAVAFPIVQNNRAADHLRVVLQLLNQPVRSHAAVGIGAGQPARAEADGMSRARASGPADVVRRDAQADDLMLAGDLCRGVAAGIQHHHDAHRLPPCRSEWRAALCSDCRQRPSSASSLWAGTTTPIIGRPRVGLWRTLRRSRLQ